MPPSESPPSTNQARPVAIVPHTHWDREWYAPFQTFRMRLVGLLDDLLPRLEADPSYRHFQLDGQMAVVDDYLAIRPAEDARLRSLATAGRLSMGPWYALPDEFLVSGETLVRNLQLGLDRAAAFGGAMQVGYLPDMFGHVAQMPQVLRGFGFEHAVVWRGVPSAIEADAFWWAAPDGSTVRAEYLLEGYGNGAHLPDDAKDLVDRIRQFEEDHESALLGPILWMNGTDHLLPQPWLGRVVAEANEVQDEYDIQVGSLADYLAQTSSDDLGRWEGELRSGARANLLMGVASNRVDIRQLAASAERDLEQLAEPLAALCLPADRWPAAFLEVAWLEVVRNSAHDSVCACSIDEVCDAVRHRYHEARQIAQGITREALSAFADSLAAQGTVVVNPSPWTRTGLVELRLPGEGEPEGLQLLGQRPTELTLPGTVGDTIQLVANTLDHQDGFHDAEVTLDDGVLHVTLRRDRRRSERARSRPVVGRIRELAPDPQAPAVLHIVRPPTRAVLARIPDLPGYGWRSWTPEALDVAPVTARDAVLANGLVHVEVDTADGTFAVDGLPGLGRLVDGGDTGDTYNYNPPRHDRFIEAPESVEVSILESGPLRARLGILARYSWPARSDGDGRVEDRPVDVRTTIELRAGERLVRVEVAFENQSRDHRLRAHFPLPRATETSRAECAFAVVERGLAAEGGPSERGLPTFPSRRFVQAGGLTVVHEGLLEYELVDVRGDTAHELALTLVRSTAMLSQGPMPYRPLPAGPLLAMEGSQLQGPLRLRYAVQVGDADPYALVDDAFLPLAVVEATGEGDRPHEGRLLSITGAEVSALRREQGALTARVFNPSAEPTRVEIAGQRGWLVDLRGEPVAPFEGGFDLGPWQIATARLA